MITPTQLEIAVAFIDADEWNAAHEIAQSHSDPIANWLHAILHKIEGDEGNSQYWYSRSQGRRYDDYASVNEELAAIVSAYDH